MAETPIQQVRNFWTKLTSIQKTTIIGVVTLAVAGIIAVVAGSGTSTKSVLFSDVDPKDASVIIEKLKERKIEYELTKGGTTILVPAEVLYDTRLALAGDGLPQSGTVGYEIFDKTNLGMSDFVQKLNYRRALEGELSRTINSLEEVQKSRVHIVVPEKALFDKDQKKPTASVILQLKSGRSVSKMNIEGIQNLIAGSIEAMEPGSVTVVDQKGQILSEAPRDKNSLAGMTSTQYELQQKIDQYLSTKAQTMLDGVLGAGNAVVRATAELDFTQIEKTVEDFDPDKQVIRSEQKIDENSHSTDSLNYPAVNSASQRGNTITNYEISKTVEKVVNNGGGVKRLTVAALINGSTKITEGDAPALEYKPRTPEQMEQLRKIIMNAVGYDPARNDQISIENIQFDITQQEEELRQLKGLRLPMTTEDIIEKVFIAIAMLLAIFMIRRLFASPEVRSRIEYALAPAEQISPALAEFTPEEQQLLLAAGETVELNAAGELPSPDDREAIIARAKAKVERSMQKEVTEDEMVSAEMRNRVLKYMEENTADTVRILKAMMVRDDEPAPPKKR